MSEFSRRRSAALARSRVLREVSASIPAADKRLNAKQGLDIANLYDELAQVYGRRSKAYAPVNRSEAFSAVTQNLLGGWYVGWRTPRLGFAPLVKDALFATLLTNRGR